MRRYFPVLGLCAGVLWGCGSSSSDLFHPTSGSVGGSGGTSLGNPAGSGGAHNTASGGTNGGGIAGASSGGITTTGGSAASSGASNSGGTSPEGGSDTGGVTAGGGAANSGGATGNGGASTDGGASNGGASGTGGATADGGATASGGSGGATSNPYQPTAAADCNGAVCNTASGAACCTIVSTSNGTRTVYATCTPAGPCALPVVTAAHCDGPEDCAQGFVCCGTSSLPGIYSDLSCVRAADCGSGKQIMCHPSNGGSQCSRGGCSPTLTLPDGYGACG